MIDIENIGVDLRRTGMCDKIKNVICNYMGYHLWASFDGLDEHLSAFSRQEDIAKLNHFLVNF